MKRLTKDNIQFIDNYLNNSDVIHIDIRLEMIDHVATAIEQEMNNGDNRAFYYIFKDYMINNKKRLLADNTKFLNGVTKKLSVQVLKELLSLKAIAIVCCAFFVLKYTCSEFGFKEIKSWYAVILFIAYCLFGLLYFFMLKKYKLQRISSVERLGFLLGILFQIFHLGWNFSKFIKLDQYHNSLLVFLSVTTALFFIIIQTTISTIKIANTKYQGIV